MKHSKSEAFRADYDKLPAEIRELADRNFALLKENSRHPSLQFKKVGKYWSARVGAHYRAVAVEASDGFVWFSIVHHKIYDRLI